MNAMRLRINRSSGPVAGRGFSLVEALVALLVLSIGLLGLALLQGQGLKFNTDAYLRTQATVLAYDIIDRMQANPTGLASGAYLVTSSGSAASKLSTYNGCKSSSCACDASTGCSTANLAIHDLGQWYANQARLLPQDTANLSTIERTNPAGSACPGKNATYTVTMRWVERKDAEGQPLRKSQAWVVRLTECPRVL